MQVEVPVMQAQNATRVTCIMVTACAFFASAHISQRQHKLWAQTADLKQSYSPLE